MESKNLCEGEEIPKKFIFDAGKLKFKEEVASVRGELLFRKPHEPRRQTPAFISTIEDDLRNWILQNFTEDEAAKLFQTTHTTAVSTAYLTPAYWRESYSPEECRRKWLWYSIFAMCEWISDNLDDRKVFREDPNFSQLQKQFARILPRIFELGYGNLAGVLEDVRESGLGKYKGYDLCFKLWFLLMKGLQSEFGYGQCPETVKIFCGTFYKQYSRNSWMKNGKDLVDSCSLYGKIILTCPRISRIV